MKFQTRWWVLALLVAGTLWLLGCEQKKRESQAPQEAPRQVQPPGNAAESGGRGDAERGGRGDTTTPAGSIAGIWTQIDAEQEKLSAAIQNGELRRVRHLALGISGLAVAVTDEASVRSPEKAPRLKSLLEQVKVSAGDLAEVGDAGDLKGTKMEFAKLNAILDAVKATVGPE